MSIHINDKMLWKQGKRRAFTLSYDDGITQDRRLVALLNQYQIKATFNLNTGLLGQEGVVSAGKKEVLHNKLSGEEMMLLYEGHEMAAHGQYHQCMIGMDCARCIEEILENRKTLESMEREPVTGFAYAFGAYDETAKKALQAAGISYARTIEATHKFEIPKDFLMWNPTCHHDDPKLFSLLDEFMSDEIYFSFLTPAKLFYVWGHSYEFDQCDNWNHIDHFLSKISGNENVWYATNNEICQYVEAYRRLLFTVDGKYVYNPSAEAVYLGGIFTKDFIEVLPGKTVKLITPVDL